MTTFKKTLRLAVPALMLMAPQIASAQEDALVDQGAQLFDRNCKTCHMVGEDARARVGPPLNDIFGTLAGEVEGFRFSPAMTEAGENGLVWTAETVADYLENPREYVPGTRMSFRGFSEAEERDAVVAYLLTFSPDYDPEAHEGVEGEDDAATE